ncbi:MAG: hypothetical protein FWC79_06775 [Oscillospiraceae bacterium]|nr:hypothetical protein [Oscillospiraceae bacterium]
MKTKIIIGAVIILIPLVFMIVLNVVRVTSAERRFNAVTTTAMTGEVVINGRSITLPIDLDTFLSSTGLREGGSSPSGAIRHVRVTDGNSNFWLDVRRDDTVQKIAINRSDFDEHRTNIAFPNDISFSSNLSDIRNILGKGDGGQSAHRSDIGMYRRHTFSYSTISLMVGADENGNILYIELFAF